MQNSQKTKESTSESTDKERERRVLVEYSRDATISRHLRSYNLDWQRLRLPLELEANLLLCLFQPFDNLLRSWNMSEVDSAKVFELLEGCDYLQEGKDGFAVFDPGNSIVVRNVENPNGSREVEVGDVRTSSRKGIEKGR